MKFHGHRSPTLKKWGKTCIKAPEPADLTHTDLKMTSKKELEKAVGDNQPLRRRINQAMDNGFRALFQRSSVDLDFHGWRILDLQDLVPAILAHAERGSIIMVDCGRGEEGRKSGGAGPLHRALQAMLADLKNRSAIHRFKAAEKKQGFTTIWL